MFKVVTPPTNRLAEFDASFAAQALVREFVIEFTEPNRTEVELVQMSALPTHSVKNHTVQLGQANAVWHEYLAPNVWHHVEQHNAQLCGTSNRFRSRHW